MEEIFYEQLFFLIKI